MRRSRGEGTIVLRSDGRWQGSLQLGGVRRYIYAKTRQEAAEKLAELQAQARRSGALADPAKRTVDDLLDLWLETKATNWKPRTLADYKEIADVYVRPALGSIPVRRLTPEQIARTVAEWQRQGKARTALKLYRALSQSLALAVRWGWLAANPCEKVDAPAYKPKRKEVWTPEELRRFLQATEGDWLWPLWVVAVATGCRVGELLALEWGDVDLGAGILNISKSVQIIGGRRTVTGPKTPAGRRTVAMPAMAVVALQAQKMWQEDLGYRGDLVFCRPNAEPLTLSVVDWQLREACRRAGVRVLSPHGLRHLHASLLLAEGLPLTEVSRRLGHASVNVTATTYAHAIRDDRAAVAALERILS